MKRLIYITTGIILLSVNTVLGAFSLLMRQDRLDYIDTYKSIAISEMERYGIPASIKLAQAILESNAGQSVLATKANNHFGIKCGSEWDGGTYYRHDDDYNDKGKLIKSCFRKYHHVAESFTAHSRFLADSGRRGRYGFLFDYEITDYKKWAHGLKRAGYATNPKYPDLLIRIIEEYHLYDFDAKSYLVVDAKQRLEQTNHVKSVRINEGENLYTLANIFDVSVEQLLLYNEEYNDATSTLPTNSLVFLQRKKNKFYGDKNYHQVSNGETMFSISQSYGIKLDKLQHMNHYDKMEQPAIGEKISLKKKIAKSQKAKVRAVENFQDLAQVSEDREEMLSKLGLEDSPSDSKKEKNVNPRRKREKALREDGDFLAFEVEVGTYEEDNAKLHPSRRQSSESVNHETESNQVLESDQGNDQNARKAINHVVSAGETLYSISRSYNVRVEDILDWNGLNDNSLRIGQVLKIGE